MTTTRTCAVVSLFNPDDGVLANAAALLSQVDNVVLVDDGSTEDPSRILAKLSAAGCTVERLSENSGIAAALNRGIELAVSRADKPDYVLTMDQDSLLEDGYVQSLVEAATAAEVQGIPVGLVAPGTVRGLPVRRRGTKLGVQLGGEPIQSGLLIPVKVLEQLGLFKAELFIDGVDTEYYLRCRNAGLETVLAPGAALNHSLGSSTPAQIMGRTFSLWGRKVNIRTAATWRYYYIFRNRILLAKIYGRRHPGWAAKGFLADFRHLALVSIFAPGRIQRIVSARAGMSDGFKGTSGRK
ncbi:glycosyltransferase family 2 protein [Pseudarthrobacter sp. NPDC055928]|uniref:glycosyltransferase family 2 protein n=1 Tax=unclassified Pseudarthrobacter TaxID=2647000 RepID=UPI0030785511